MTYVSACLADNPRHFWRLADPGGVLVHDIGSVPFTLMQNSNYPQGMPYTGPNSDGGSFCGQGVSYPWFNEDLDPMAPPLSLEIMAWQQADIATQQIMFAIRTGANVSWVEVSATRKLRGIGGGGAAAAEVANFPLQTWQHIVLTITAAGAATLYRNALNVGAAASGIPGTGNYRFSVGGNTSAFANAFQGAIAEAAIYPSVLTPTQINNHFLALDNASSKPVYRSGGLYPNSTGGTTLDSQNIADILSSVRKAF